MVKIQDITLGQYAPRESAIHRLDPRIKVVASFFWMTYLLIARRVELLFLFGGMVLLLFLLARLHPMLALRNLKPFWILFLLTLLLHGMFTKGRVLWEIPWVSVMITLEGLYQGLFYALRIAILVVVASLLTLTTSPMALTDGLERFLDPLRRVGIPVHEMAMMFSLSLRFIPILLEETERIRKAQLSRGAGFEGHIFRRIRSVVPIVVPLFLSTFRRANDLALAMNARCYRGSEGRTNYYVLRFRRADVLALAMVLMLGVPAVLYR